MNSPLVTVLMPVCNSAPYLRTAMESILGQSFRDFEFLIIDDGSTDSSREIIESYTDQRVRLEQNPRNMGLPRTLNRGLELARGEFIARMDGDDEALPERLRKQLETMKAHPEIGICGSWIKMVGGVVPAIVRYPTEHEEIRAELFVYSALAHPTVMMRASVLKENNLRYDENMFHAEDYDLWARAAKVTRLANIPDVLLDYRIHPQQTCKLKECEQGRSAASIRRRLLDEFAMNLNPDEYLLHEKIMCGSLPFSREDFRRALEWLERLRSENGRKGLYEPLAFNRALSVCWFNLCNFATSHGIETLFAYFSSKPAWGSGPGTVRLGKFLLKCLLRYPWKK